MVFLAVAVFAPVWSPTPRSAATTTPRGQRARKSGLGFAPSVFVDAYAAPLAPSLGFFLEVRGGKGNLDTFSS